ncbi:MAG: DUF2339 domain-containing protein [Gaiellaceae bacterium]
MDPALLDRLARCERQLRALEAELSELRRLAGAAAAPASPPASPARPRPAEPPKRPEPRATPPTPPPPRRSWDLLALDPSALLGARALALAGGVVTLLGILFFFVLAVNRGWIGPSARVGLGGLASALVFGGGLYLRRRFGETHAALAAVAAGIAGGYATLLAAASLYDLVPGPLALVLAAAIAGVGVATSIAWSAQIVAGLGLIGALLVPLAAASDHGLTDLGTGFAAIVLAGTIAVSVLQRWRGLLVAAGLASVPQIVALAGTRDAAKPAALTLAALFAGLYLAASISFQVRLGSGLDRLPASFALLGAAAGGTCAAILLDEVAWRVSALGLALLALAAAYAVSSAVLFQQRARRDLSALLGAIALGLTALALAELFSGATLAIAWAAEAAVLAWLARRIDESRYELASLVYLVLAVGHALGLDAPFDHLFRDVPDPASGALSLVAAAAGAAAFAFHCRPWRDARADEGGRFLAKAVADLELARPALRAGTAWLAPALTVYAASLVLLELFSSFDWGHAAVTGLWSATGAAVVGAGLARGSDRLQVGGGAFLVAALAKAGGFDLETLALGPRSTSFAVVAAVTLGAGLAAALLNERLRGLNPLTFVSVPLSAGFAAGAIVPLVDGDVGGIDLEGASLLGLAGLFGFLGAALFHRPGQRDLSTLLWATGLLIAVPAAAELLPRTPLVAWWAAAAAGLAWLAGRLDESRLRIASAVHLALGAGLALALAPPEDLLSAQARPATGVPALAAVAAAAAGFAFLGREEPAPWNRATRITRWLAGGFAVYGASLSILGLFEWLSLDDVETSFQRGHTAVSAVWGLLGLALLYLGLTRARGSLRLAGFALFGASVAKIFLYDLAFLSSVARAFSFLAVGAVLLLGGFLYQRLAAGEGGRLPSEG